MLPRCIPGSVAGRSWLSFARRCAFHVSSISRQRDSPPSKQFVDASVRVRSGNTDYATLLQLYALFKQATVGPNTRQMPWMLELMVGGSDTV